MSIEYAIIVKPKTRLEMLNERFNTKSQAKFYIKRQGGNFEDYEEEHEQFHQTLDKVQSQLSRVIKYKIVERSYLSSYIFSEKNLILVIGQDGLVANTAKYARGRPIVAVNPDPGRYDGILLPFRASDFLHAIEGIIDNHYTCRETYMAEVRLQDGQRLLAFNDLFIGAASHVSARYRLTYNGHTEEQSSSGIIVSTRMGATGWMSSIFNMAYGITSLFEGNRTVRQPQLNDNELLFAVREPFKSIRTQINLSIGSVNETSLLQIESMMLAGGVIFSDGIESDYLTFNSGAIASIGIASETANLVQPG